MSGTLARLTERLRSELRPEGYWTGELSSSALSTAVATIALGEMDRQHGRSDYSELIPAGLEWLAQNANADGGWGDTIRSRSNISTTALCWAAFGSARADGQFGGIVRAAERWLTEAAGSLERLPEAIAGRYGKDRTFSVPILMTLAISGRLPPKAWRNIPALPFELAVLPREFFGALRLPVVSYALPALIAIGNAIHFHAPSRNPLWRALRRWAAPKTFRLLSAIQPENGGFLEATPLTAFVTMSLAVSGEANHAVAAKAASFLRNSVRGDGSWPIDTNLATWVTTLSIKALSHQPGALSADHMEALREWLLQQQTANVHSYTGAAPGAWAWTDLPGGVPDADDTAGALLALGHIGKPGEATIAAAQRGVEWLLDLQNRDGGIPTFCPGWGTLPFDRSTPELTAHALRAWQRWRTAMHQHVQTRIRAAMARAIRYLGKAQKPDGSFIPLWFGNEFTAQEENPVYGTAQVLIALNEARLENTVPLVQGAARFLQAAQRSSGGWGGDAETPETIEETALALEALAGTGEHPGAVQKGTERLLELVAEEIQPAPIGLYFARLWYFERLYPLIFAASALGKIASQHR